MCVTVIFKQCVCIRSNLHPCDLFRVKLMICMPTMYLEQMLKMFALKNQLHILS